MDSKGYVATGPTCGPTCVIFAPALKHRESPDNRGYVATGPTCGPLVFLFRALKHQARPHTAGVMSPLGPLLGHL